MDRAARSLANTQSRYKRDLDRSVRASNKQLTAGDFVFIDNPEHQPGKLEHHVQGPYKVISNDGHTFTIDRDGALEKINSDRITSAPRPTTAPRADSQGFLSRKSLPSDVQLSGQQCVVDKLMGRHTDNDGHDWYHVKWYGYRERTWEPAAALSAELASAYDRKRPKQSSETR